VRKCYSSTESLSSRRSWPNAGPKQASAAAPPNVDPTGSARVKPSETRSLYDDAHLFVAAVRFLTHQQQSPPDLAEVCRSLALSQERGGFVCRRLMDIGAVETIRGAYGDRLFIRDHRQLETLPREDQTDGLQVELDRFQETQKGLASKVENIRAEQARKKKDLFSEMEKKLRQEIEKKSS
jgi:hypothetical protein